MAKRFSISERGCLIYCVAVIEFSFRTRRQNLERMAGEEWDLVVVGGGIHGAGVARDASLRGLKVALVEKGDFAGGTSSKSSKLIHGGLRYLEQFDFGLVRESCRERRILLDIAPHLVKPLPFLFPIYKGDRPPWMVRIGMTLYDALSMFRNVGRHRMLTPREALALEPALKPQSLCGAAKYWDCQENDARFCLANVIDAAENGATCANHVEVREFGSTSGRLAFAVVEDRISESRFEIRAKAFVNAGGPWVDRIANLANSHSTIQLRPTKGIHLVARRLTEGHGLLLQAIQDKRVFFVIPWGDGHSLIGTTDTDFKGDPDCVEAKCRDVEYLLEATNHALPSLALTKDDVLSTFAGLRPLLGHPGGKPSDLTRKHQLKTSPSGLISIVGGKYTTYRAVAEEVVDLVCNRLGRHAKCSTTKKPLSTNFLSELPISLEAAVRHAVEHEMAMTVCDFVLRRTRLGYTELNREPLVRSTADEMQKLLGWAEDEKSRQTSACLTTLQ